MDEHRRQRRAERATRRMSGLAPDWNANRPERRRRVEPWWWRTFA